MNTMDLVLDIPEDIPEESKGKKVVIFVLGCFLAFLMLSYAAISYGVGDMLAGWAQSSSIENNSVLFKEGKILFLGSTYSDLLNLWNQYDGLEFKVCFLGKKAGEEYQVESLFVPKMFEQTYRSVSSEDCPTGTIIDAHSHPFKRCIASFQDMMSHREFKKRNPETLMAVFCDRDRMNIYQ